MKRSLVGVISAILIMAFVVYPVTHASALGMLQTEFTLNRSSSSGISFEVKVPWQSLSLASVQLESETYTSIALPGSAATAEEGAPQLPLVSQMLAVPFGVELELRVVPGKAHSQKIIDPVLPVPTQSVDLPSPDDLAAFNSPQVKLSYIPDHSVYDGQANIPGKMGEIANDDVIRQQRVIAIVVYPVQYDPLKSELTVYESFSVTVSFKSQAQTLSAPNTPESTYYEDFFKQELLNYESSKSWRRPVSAQRELSVTTHAVTAASTLPWVPPDPGWRIKVREQGFYRLTYDSLLAAGLDVESLNSKTFQMFNLGQEVAILVEGEEDDSFDPTDSVVFFAESIEDKYTADNVYWLTYGAQTGLRMAGRSVAPQTAALALSFTGSKRFEVNKWYLTALSGNDDLERFLWDYIFAQGTTPKDWIYTFPLAAATQEAGQLNVTMMGYTNLPQDHHAVISLNNTVLGDIFWQGQTWAQFSAAIPSGTLVPGNNTLKITLPNDQGAPYDYIYLDRFDISFASTFLSQANALSFNYDLTQDTRFQLQSFSTSELALFDVTDSTQPVELSAFDVLPSGSTFDLSFQEQTGIVGNRNYWAAGSNTFKTVTSIERDTPSSLHLAENGADHLVLTHAAFLGPAQTLASYRAAQGMRAKVVDVQDIYDQFGFGIAGSEPIRAFLQYAYQYWASPAPTYVLLMGDGHYNPKGYNPGLYGVWRENFIPPYLALADPLLGETAADNRYVTLVGDDHLPDMLLGRMAVTTEAQANAFVNKTIAYEQSPSTIDWSIPVLAVADNPDNGGNFPAISQFLLSSSLPSDYQAERVYLGVTHMTASAARTAVINGINSGKFLVNYIGHAAERQWAGYDDIASYSGTLLDIADVAALTNLNKYPIISAMTCKEGYYINPNPIGSNYEALAEVITRAENKGAVASFSPTGNSLASGHDIINRGLFDAIFTDLAPTIGLATQQSLLDLWTTGTYLDLADTYLLFGDPALRFTRGLMAISDTYVTDEELPLNVSSVNGVLKNDINPEELILSAEFVSGSGPNYGTLSTFNSDGSFTYVPNIDFYGTDTFSYRIYDGMKNSNEARVAITVNPINDPPIAQDQSVTTTINTPVDIVLTALDDEGGGSVSSLLTGPDQSSLNQLTALGLTFTITTQPANGNLVVDPIDSSKLNYTPNLGFSGTDLFKFIANDGQYDSNEATVTITVTEWKLNLPIIFR